MNGEEATPYPEAEMAPSLPHDAPESQMPTVGTLPWVDQLNYSHQFIYSKQYLAKNKKTSCYPECPEEEIILQSADPTVIFTPPYVLAMLNQQKNEEYMNRRMKYLIENNENLVENEQPDSDPVDNAGDCAPFPMNCVFNKQPQMDCAIEEGQQSPKTSQEEPSGGSARSSLRRQSQSGQIIKTNPSSEFENSDHERVSQPELNLETGMESNESEPSCLSSAQESSNTSSRISQTNGGTPITSHVSDDDECLTYSKDCIEGCECCGSKNSSYFDNFASINRVNMFYTPASNAGSGKSVQSPIIGLAKGVPTRNTALKDKKLSKNLNSSVSNAKIKNGQTNLKNISTPSISFRGSQQDSGNESECNIADNQDDVIQNNMAQFSKKPSVNDNIKKVKISYESFCDDEVTSDDTNVAGSQKSVKRNNGSNKIDSCLSTSNSDDDDNSLSVPTYCNCYYIKASHEPFNGNDRDTSCNCNLFQQTNANIQKDSTNRFARRESKVNGDYINGIQINRNINSKDLGCYCCCSNAVADNLERNKNKFSRYHGCCCAFNSNKNFDFSKRNESNKRVSQSDSEAEPKNFRQFERNRICCCNTQPDFGFPMQNISNKRQSTDVTENDSKKKKKIYDEQTDFRNGNVSNEGLSKPSDSDSVVLYMKDSVTLKKEKALNVSKNTNEKGNLCLCNQSSTDSELGTNISSSKINYNKNHEKPCTPAKCLYYDNEKNNNSNFNEVYSRSEKSKPCTPADCNHFGDLGDPFRSPDDMNKSQRNKSCTPADCKKLNSEINRKPSTMANCSFINVEETKTNDSDATLLQDAMPLDRGLSTPKPINSFFDNSQDICPITNEDENDLNSKKASSQNLTTNDSSIQIEPFCNCYYLSNHNKRCGGCCGRKKSCCSRASSEHFFQGNKQSCKRNTCPYFTLASSGSQRCCNKPQKPSKCCLKKTQNKCCQGCCSTSQISCTPKCMETPQCSGRCCDKMEKKSCSFLDIISRNQNSCTCCRPSFGCSAVAPPKSCCKQRACQLEQRYSTRGNDCITLILRFPDPIINCEELRNAIPCIKSIQCENPSARCCLIQLKPNVDPVLAMKSISCIPFGCGYLCAEMPRLQAGGNDEIVSDYDSIDPLTLYIGNLPMNVKIADLKKMFPRALRIDIGFGLRVKRTRYAFVKFRTFEESAKNFETFVNTSFQSKNLIVRFKRSKLSKHLTKQLQYKPNSQSIVNEARKNFSCQTKYGPPKSRNASPANRILENGKDVDSSKSRNTSPSNGKNNDKNPTESKSPNALLKNVGGKSSNTRSNHSVAENLEKKSSKSTYLKSCNSSSKRYPGLNSDESKNDGLKTAEKHTTSKGNSHKSNNLYQKSPNKDQKDNGPDPKRPFIKTELSDYDDDDEELKSGYNLLGLRYDDNGARIKCEEESQQEENCNINRPSSNDPLTMGSSVYAFEQTCEYEGAYQTCGTDDYGMPVQRLVFSPVKYETNEMRYDGSMNYNNDPFNDNKPTVSNTAHSSHIRMPTSTNVSNTPYIQSLYSQARHYKHSNRVPSQYDYIYEQLESDQETDDVFF